MTEHALGGKKGSLKTKRKGKEQKHKLVKVLETDQRVSAVDVQVAEGEGPGSAGVGLHVG